MNSDEENLLIEIGTLLKEHKGKAKAVVTLDGVDYFVSLDAKNHIVFGDQRFKGDETQ